MKYNFDEIVDRKGTFSMKWDCGDFLKNVGLTERFDEDTIPVHSADMDFRCAQPIANAVKRLAERNLYGYTAVFPSGVGLTYYIPIIRWFKEKRGWNIQPEEIIYVNGTVEALYYAIRTFTEKGDGVLINRPVYKPFTEAIEETGRVVVNSQLINHDGYYTVDFDDFQAKASQKNTKLFILCHPHNPSGRIWKDEELERMADICKANDILIISDEIHGDLIRKGMEFHPLATVVDPSGIITCTSPNKTFNLAGLQAANIVIQDKKLMEQFTRATGLITPNPFTVAAVMAAYSAGEEWLEQLRDYLDGNIDWVLDFLKNRMPKVKCFRPEGTYIMWLDFRDYGLTPNEIHRRIYVDANVILEGGAVFDPERGDGFERICVPTRRALLIEALERIEKQFREL